MTHQRTPRGLRLYLGGDGVQVEVVEWEDGHFLPRHTLPFSIPHECGSRYLVIGEMVAMLSEGETASVYCLTSGKQLRVWHQVRALFGHSQTRSLAVIQEPGGDPGWRFCCWTSERTEVDLTAALQGVDLDGVYDGAICPSARGSSLLLTSYGYCQLLALQGPFGDRTMRCTSHRRLRRKFAYDPISVLSQEGHTALLWHGYGVGLAAVDLLGGHVRACPMPPPCAPEYGFFQGAILNEAGTEAWVQTKSGPYSWDLGQLLTPLPKGTEGVFASVSGQWLALRPLK